MITLGNHTWRRTEIGPYLGTSEQVIRPANFSASAPGRGLAVRPAADGTPVAVLNLLGSLFLSPPVSMFELVDDLVEQARAQTPVVIVDLHAEATSEKVALGWYLDGRVLAVIGVKSNLAIHRMRTGMPVRFETAEGGVRIEGALIECDPSGRATAIEPVRVSYP